MPKRIRRLLLSFDAASRLFVVLASLMMLGGCDEGRLGGDATVPEVIDNIHRWDGKVYRVQGWLGECGGMDCGLYETKADAVLAQQAEVDDEWMAAMDRRLSITSMGDFDAQAEPLQFQYVQVTALIDDVCRGWWVGCTDRAPDLIPFSIEPLATKAEK